MGVSIRLGPTMARSKAELKIQPDSLIWSAKICNAGDFEARTVQIHTAKQNINQGVTK